MDVLIFGVGAAAFALLGSILWLVATISVSAATADEVRAVRGIALESRDLIKALQEEIAAARPTPAPAIPAPRASGPRRIPIPTLTSEGCALRPVTLTRDDDPAHTRPTRAPRETDEEGDQTRAIDSSGLAAALRGQSA